MRQGKHVRIAAMGTKITLPLDRATHSILAVGTEFRRFALLHDGDFSLPWTQWAAAYTIFTGLSQTKPTQKHPPLKRKGLGNTAENKAALETPQPRKNTLKTRQLWKPPTPEKIPTDHLHQKVKSALPPTKTSSQKKERKKGGKQVGFPPTKTSHKKGGGVRWDSPHQNFPHKKKGRNTSWDTVSPVLFSTEMKKGTNMILSHAGL